ncbi:MAG TPA: glycosyltransferase [Candidatus Levybacteria bacterium]|nr:glycosyltransferase [Candidatus Levybacteria bacterium]
MSNKFPRNLSKKSKRLIQDNYIYSSVLFCTADPTKDAGGIAKYFVARSKICMTFYFPLGYMSKPTYFRKYKMGVLESEKIFHSYTGRNTFIKNIQNYLFFIYCLLFFVPRKTFILTNAPIYCFGYFIFAFIKLHKYILWLGDYYPQKSIFIYLHNIFIDYLNKNLQYVLYISPPLSRLYESKRRNKKYTKVIQLGMENEKITYKKNKSKIKLGFIGILRNQQGIELAFSYLALHKNISLDIVGGGYWLAYYKKLARKLNINSRVTFYGSVDDVSTIFQKWDIGIALYEDTVDNLSRYCEPTKLKKYLSYGLPVITTRATYFSREIEESGVGVVIDENTYSLGVAIKNIILNYDTYQHKIGKLLKKYEYVSWYDKKFAFMR